MKSTLVLSFALLLVVNAASGYLFGRRDMGRRGMDRRLFRQQEATKDEFERLVMLCLMHPPPPPPPDASSADDSSAPGEVPPAEAQLREMIYRELERQGGPAGPSGNKEKDYKKKMGRILKGLVKCVMGGGPPQVLPPLPSLAPPEEKPAAAPMRALLKELLRVSPPGEAGAIPELPSPGAAVSELVVFCLGALENKSVLPEEGRRALMLRWARQPEAAEDELEKLVKKLAKCVKKKGQFGKESSSDQD